MRPCVSRPIIVSTPCRGPVGRGTVLPVLHATVDKQCGVLLVKLATGPSKLPSMAHVSPWTRYCAKHWVCKGGQGCARSGTSRATSMPTQQRKAQFFCKKASLSVNLAKTASRKRRLTSIASCTVHLSKTKLPIFSSRRTDFRPGFSHSRAQDVSTHVRNVPNRQILRKLASAANAGQTSFFNRISTPDPSWVGPAWPAKRGLEWKSY